MKVKKIQYNYAQHTGISPKEMNWFYRGLNAFYDNNNLSEYSAINGDMVHDCFAYLFKSAAENEDKLSYLYGMEPRKLAAWIQSTHEAAIMTMGVNYTVRLEQVRVGDEEIPLQEIYPLTKDMQAAVGSTFSHGVHQLLAERLNYAAQLKNKPQNFHVHPESHIVSSQVFSQRLKDVWSKWEGFTGTVSATQAQQLNGVYETQVLRVPTNQKDLRKWPAPQFFDAEAQQLQAIADKIKQALREKKSILWCCETDRKVLEMQEKIKRYFTAEEWDTHFMVFTNESDKTAAEVFRDKKAKEGLSLGQKERGVVLMAAAFGRGDNVDVEMLILQSVHDENDLGQKGGRTARNGEEGEVQQFYMKTEIDTEFKELLVLIKKSTYSAYTESIMQQIKHLLDDISTADQFKLILRLREFIQSVDNQASVYYHESKAQLSSGVIAILGQIQDPDVRERLAQSFSAYLDELEKTWTSIKANTYNTQESITGLKKYFDGDLIAKVSELLPAGQTLSINFGDYQPLVFLLEPEKTEVDALTIKTAIQHRLLAVDDLPIDVGLWTRIQEGLARLEKAQLTRFYEGIRDITPLVFIEFIAQLDRAATEVGEFYAEAEGYTFEAEGWLSLLSAIPTLAEELGTAVEKLEARTQADVKNYLRKPGLAEISKHVQKTLPLLNYVASLPATEAEKAYSYFSEPSLVDRLVTLPPACFELFASAKSRKNSNPQTLALSAGTLLQIKNFLDQYLSDEDDARYSSIFKKIATGAVHQTDKRLRWFERFIMILEQVDNKIELIDTLSSLMLTFKNEEHFAFLELLLNKMAPLFKEPLKFDNKTIDQERYHGLLKTIHQRCPELLGGLKPIDAMLRREGKAFFFHTESMLVILSTEVIITYQEVLTKLAVLKSTEKKADEIQSYKKIFTQLKNFSAITHSAKIIESMLHLQAHELIIALDKFFSNKLFKGDNEQFFAYLISDSAILAEVEDVEKHLMCLKTVQNGTPSIECNRYFQWLTSYIKNPDVNFSRFKALMGLETLSDNDKVIELWQNSERIKAISALKEPQYQALFVTLGNAQVSTQLMKNPLTLDTYLKYLASESFDAIQAPIFANLLAKICETCNQAQASKYLELLNQMIGNKDKLQITLELITESPTFMLEIASNGLADYIIPNRANKNEIKEAIKTFYLQRAQDSLPEPGLFDFASEPQKAKRITWMKLLHEHHCVTKDDINSDWTQQMNGDYYTKNLGKYGAFIEETFKPNPSLSNTRALEVSKLHHIPEELANIASVTEPSNGISDELNAEISKVLEHYKKAWFKNAERQRRVVELEALLKQPVRSPNAYLELIVNINVLKLNIQQKDTDTNLRSPLRLFKPLHWFGNSRLQNTLNTIQDTIIKAWLKDPKQMQSFQENYKTTVEPMIEQKITALTFAINAWEIKNDALVGKLSILKPMFFSDKTLQALRNLSNALNGRHSLGNKLQAIRNVGDDIEQLPGDLKILVKEILAYSEDLPNLRKK